MTTCSVAMYEYVGSKCKLYSESFFLKVVTDARHKPSMVHAFAMKLTSASKSCDAEPTARGSRQMAPSMNRGWRRRAGAACRRAKPP